MGLQWQSQRQWKTKFHKVRELQITIEITGSDLRCVFSFYVITRFWPSVINNFVWHNRGYERRRKLDSLSGVILTQGAGRGHWADSLIARKYCPRNIIIIMALVK